jgi:hypothetical protein
LFMDPQDLVGGKTDREMISQGACLGKELYMAGMDDVITAGDKDAFHEQEIKTISLKSAVERSD